MKRKLDDDSALGTLLRVRSTAFAFKLPNCQLPDYKIFRRVHNDFAARSTGSFVIDGIKAKGSFECA